METKQNKVLITITIFHKIYKGPVIKYKIFNR